MRLAFDYHSSKPPQAKLTERFVTSNVNARASMISQSAGFLYFDNAGMVRGVFAPEVVFNDNTGAVAEANVSVSSTECMGLTLGPAVLKVFPVVLIDADMPSWAISGHSSNVLDITALTQAGIDTTAVGSPLKIGLIPLILPFTFTTEAPVDNLDMSNSEHVVLLEKTYGPIAAEWANVISSALDDWTLSCRVLERITDQSDCVNQIGPRMGEFATKDHLHMAEPTLTALHFTATSHPTKHAALLDRMGGLKVPAAITGMPGPAVPPSPSALIIEDASTIKERTLLSNAEDKRKIMFLHGEIDQTKMMITVTGFAEETAGMSAIASMKTASERTDNLVSMWNTNASKPKKDPAFKFHREVHMRNNEFFDPNHGGMFISATFSSTPIQSNNTSTTYALNVYAWKKNGKEVAEAIKNELSRQTMELMHGESDSNRTKMRTTVSAMCSVSDLKEVGHITANLRGTLESMYKCSSTTSPIVYKYAGLVFDFAMNEKTDEWVKRHQLEKIPHLLVNTVDCVLAAAAAMSNEYENKMGSKMNIISKIDTTEFGVAVMKGVRIIVEIERARDYDIAYKDYPHWIEQMFAKPAGPLSPSKRTHTGSAVTFDRTPPSAGTTPPAPGLATPGGTPSGSSTKQPSGGRNAGTGAGVFGWIANPDQKWERGKLRESDGGHGIRRPNKNGCYLYLPKQENKPADALCSEVRAIQCAHHAVATYYCELTSDKKCPHGLKHEWWHQYDESLKTKQLDYMEKNRTVVQFNPRANATVRALPSDKGHLVGSNTPAGGEH